MPAGRREASPRAAGRFWGVAIGLTLDALLGEPPNQLHPVLGWGRALQRLERISHRDSHLAGFLHLAVAGSAAWLFGRQIERQLGHVAGTAVSVWLVSASSMLNEEARTIHAHLTEADLGRARSALSGLVGRDTDELDESEMARAVIESVAENTVDAVTASMLWAQALGPAGAWTHRVVNTLDAMIGHRDERHGRFGWASARADDALNFIPARATAAAVAIVGPASISHVRRVVRRDGGKHPSPNGGRIEAAVAAALGRTLGGTNSYRRRAEDRGKLGAGPNPTGPDIERAIRLMSRATVAVLAGQALSVFAATRRSRARQ